MADHVVVEKETKESGSGSGAIIAIVAIVVLVIIAWFAFQYFGGGSVEAPTTNVNITAPTTGTGQ